jgi:2',3'-cyclic-nucleotide 2'-phosphodiesterase (5'-nucleotidase family)
VLQATEQAHRATVAWVTTPIGRTDVAWRADSARVVDTPLLDFVLEVERRAANADLAAAAAFSLDASIDSGRSPRRACKRCIRTTTPCARFASADASSANTSSSARATT